MVKSSYDFIDRHERLPANSIEENITKALLTLHCPVLRLCSATTDECRSKKTCPKAGSNLKIINPNYFKTTFFTKTLFSEFTFTK